MFGVGPLCSNFTFQSRCKTVFLKNRVTFITSFGVKNDISWYLQKLLFFNIFKTRAGQIEVCLKAQFYLFSTPMVPCSVFFKGGSRCEGFVSFQWCRQQNLPNTGEISTAFLSSHSDQRLASTCFLCKAPCMMEGKYTNNK